MWTNDKISKTLDFIWNKVKNDDFDDLQPIFLTFEKEKKESVESRFFYELIIVLCFCSKCNRMNVIPIGFFDYHLSHEIAEAYRIWYKNHFIRTVFWYSNSSDKILEFFEGLKDIQDDVYKNRERLQICIYRNFLSKMGIKLDDSIQISSFLLQKWKIFDKIHYGFLKEALSLLDDFEKEFDSWKGLSHTRKKIQFKMNPSIEILETLSIPEFKSLPSFNCLRNNIIYIDMLSQCRQQNIKNGHLVERINSCIHEPLGEDELTVSYILPLWEHIKTISNVISTENYLPYLENLVTKKSKYLNINLFCDYIYLKYCRKNNGRGLCELFSLHKDDILMTFKIGEPTLKLNMFYYFVTGFLQDNRLHLIPLFQDILDEFFKTKPFLSSRQKKKTEVIKSLIETIKFETENLSRKGFLIIHGNPIDCLICFENTSNSVVQCTNCKNIIGHFTCIHKWFQKNMNCPLCRFSSLDS